MGGNSTANQAEQEQLQIAQQNQSLDQQYAATAQQYLQYGQQLQQPLVNFDTALASGNPTQVMQAAAPGLANITQGGQQATEQIYNNVPAGAGRQEALSQVPISTYGQSASYLNNIVNAAPQQLAQLGAGQLSLGTTQEGAAQGAGSLATSSAGGAAQEANQGKAATLGFLGSLAGAAGSAASGTDFS
jgi:hypothetical protein